MLSKRTLIAAALILLPIGAVAALIQAADDPPTELYVRTTPAGATLFLDGKKLGTSPDIFEVAPGKHELLSVLDGYKSVKRDVMVPATRIKRLLLQLESVSSRESLESAGPLPAGKFGLSSEKATTSKIAPDNSTVKAARVQRILRDYAEAVWGELPDKLRGVKPEENEEIIARVTSKLAARHIMPHVDLLAAHYLEQLPKADPINPSQWKVKLQQTPPSRELEGPLGQILAWHPTAMASFYCDQMLVRELGAESFAKLSVLRSCGPVNSVALNAQIDRPVIATLLGNEMIVVHLERADGTVYRCREVQWLAADVSTSQKFSLSPPNASQAQKLVREFRLSAWRHCYPKLNELGVNQIAYRVHEMGDTYFKGNADELRREATRILNKLPTAAPIDRSKWVSRFSEAEKEMSSRRLKIMAERMPPMPYLSQGWDPVVLARSIRMQCRMSIEGPEAFGLRAMVEAVAIQPLDTVADVDPDYPVLVHRTGDEIMIVHLRRTLEGAYVPEELEWLVRPENGP